MAYKSEAMSKKEKRMIYVVPDTCFSSNIAQEDNSEEETGGVIYRSDVMRLIEKVHEHNSVYNQVTATFMIPAPLLGEVFSNVNTMNELEYIINGTPYTPISNQQENPIRLTNEKKRRVFDVGVRTK